MLSTFAKFCLISGAILLSWGALATLETETDVLASWVCEGESIGLHRQVNGEDGVFSDYVPSDSGAEVHFVVSKDGHEGLSIHTKDEDPVLISNKDIDSSVLWAQSPDRFNEHFWAYKANYSFELYKQKNSPTKFYGYEISTSFYDTLDGDTRLRQFTRLYDCERVEPMDADRLLVVHRSPKQNYTCLREPFQVQRDNQIRVNGLEKQIKFSSVDTDGFSSVAPSKKHDYVTILRKSRYNMYLLDNEDVFAINPTTLVGIRIVDAEVQNVKYQCLLD